MALQLDPSNFHMVATGEMDPEWNYERPLYRPATYRDFLLPSGALDLAPGSDIWKAVAQSLYDVPDPNRAYQAAQGDSAQLRFALRNLGITDPAQVDQLLAGSEFDPARAQLGLQNILDQQAFWDSDDSFNKSALGGLAAFLSAGLAGPLSGALGGGMTGAAGSGAILGGGTTAAGGGDPLKGALLGGAGGALSDLLFGVSPVEGTVDPVTAFDAAQGTPMHEFGGYIPAEAIPVSAPASIASSAEVLPARARPFEEVQELLGPGLRVPSNYNYDPGLVNLTYDPALGTGIRAVGSDVANLADLTRYGLGGVTNQISGLEGALGSGLASMGGNVATLADLTRSGLGGVSNQISGMEGSLGTGIGGVSNQVAGLSDSVNAGNTRLSGQLGGVETNLGSGIRTVGRDVNDLEDLTRSGLGGVSNQIAGMEGSLGTGIRGVGSDVANLAELTKYGLAGMNSGIAGVGDKVSGLGDIFNKGLGGLGTVIGGGLTKLGDSLLADNKNNRLAQILGAAIPAGIGAFAANKQTEAFERLAREQMAFGAPSRQRFESSFAPGFTMANDPGYTDMMDQTAKTTLHGMAVGGNPAGSPNAWARTLEDLNAKVAYPALQDYRRLNAGAGGLAALTAASPGTATNAINAGKGVWDAIGGGVADIFNPPTPIEELLRKVKGSGMKLSMI